MPFVTHVRCSAAMRSCPRYSASQQESALMAQPDILGVVAEEPLPCTGAVPLACVKGDAQKEALAEAAGPGKGPELVSESVSAGRPHQPGSSKPIAGRGPAEPPRDAASAPAARVVTKDAALPDQANADNRSLGRAPAAPADGTPAQGAKQVILCLGTS